MEDYYIRFVHQCLRRCTSFSDFSDKKKVRKHNNAMDRIVSVSKEMYAEPDKGASVVLELLKHEDERVRIMAGAYCIQAQILVAHGESVLTQIVNSPSSNYFRTAAQDTLKYCRPF